MKEGNKQIWISQLNIRHVMLIGLVFRLICVVFSKGYAFHDDHFEMAELVQRWRDGYSFLWTGADVHVFSLVYPGFLYLVFEVCHAIGLHDPEQVLFVTRLIHALISLLSIWYGYKLVLRLSNEKKSALVAALFMATFWLFPFMSVRNLREFLCVPFLLAGCYHIANPGSSYRSVFFATFMFALAFTIRLQVLFIPFGIGIYLLTQKAYLKKAVLFALFFAICFMLTQGLFDLIYYGDPIASIKEYLRFNSDKANIMIQPTGPWYLYLGTLAGVFFGFPFLLMAVGFFNSWKSKPSRMIIVGSVFFFAFHSYYSNKQERFILPFIPFFIILGIIGLSIFLKRNKEKSWLSIARFISLWLIVLNTIALIVLSFTYSKKSRVESMLYLRKRGDVSNLIIESEAEAPRPPLYYLGKEVNFYTLTAADSLPKLTLYIPNGPYPEPNYIIMSGNHKLPERVERLKKLYPQMKFEKSFSPGLIDNIAYRLNPNHNDNETWYIYRVE